MDNKALQQYVEQVSIQSFGKTFNHQTTFNDRLKTTGGRYFAASHNLEFNHKVLDYFGENEFLGVVKHELCHYHLHLEGSGFQHKDKDFKKLLKKVGGSRYVQSLLPYTVKQILIYECYSCHTVYNRNRRIDTKKYVCGKCGGKLKLVDKKGVNHENT